MALQTTTPTLPLLPLSNMDQRHRGLTPAIAATFEEAARVCLDQHHSSPQEFVVEDDGNKRTVLVQWETTDTRTRDAWANAIDTTESGAYGCALAATEVCRNLVAMKRAETLTGADYYIGPTNVPVDDLEDYFRLEISGSHLDRGHLNSRLKDKIEQTLNGISNLPALAAVVGIRVRLILLQTVRQK